MAQATTPPDAQAAVPCLNRTCYFVFMPLAPIRGIDPFTVNTVNGFVTP